jgi:hypothetical protein
MKAKSGQLVFTTVESGKGQIHEAVSHTKVLQNTNIFYQNHNHIQIITNGLSAVNDLSKHS